MEVNDIIDSFEDYRLESHNDSIDIDKLKEVLPNMIQQLVYEKVKQERDKIVGYIEFDKEALLQEARENISVIREHVWLVLNKIIRDFNNNWKSNEEATDGMNKAVEEIIGIADRSIKYDYGTRRSG